MARLVSTFLCDQPLNANLCVRVPIRGDHSVFTPPLPIDREIVVPNVGDAAGRVVIPHWPAYNAVSDGWIRGRRDHDLSRQHRVPHLEVKGTMESRSGSGSRNVRWEILHGLPGEGPLPRHFHKGHTAPWTEGLVV